MHRHSTGGRESLCVVGVNISGIRKLTGRNEAKITGLSAFQKLEANQREAYARLVADRVTLFRADRPPVERWQTMEAYSRIVAHIDVLRGYLLDRDPRKIEPFGLALLANLAAECQCAAEDLGLLHRLGGKDRDDSDEGDEDN